jgi:hypothetical protein
MKREPHIEHSETMGLPFLDPNYRKPKAEEPEDGGLNEVCSMDESTDRQRLHRTTLSSAAAHNPSSNPRNPESPMKKRRMIPEIVIYTKVEAPYEFC